MSRFTVILPAISLAAMVWCAYFPATGAGFIWDDDQHFVEDRLMTEPDGLYRIWFAPGQSVWNYWPISRTSFWIERRLWDIDASASHVVNILLHTAGVLILYLGLRRFKVPNAWFIGALFALHPVFVESVAWITERKNVLSAVFYLLCIWSYLNFDENRKWRWYGSAIFLFACCLLSKSSTIMLPVILVICRLALRRPWERRDVLFLVPFFLLSLLSAGASIWFEENIVGSWGAEFEWSGAQRLAVAGRIPFFYLQKILFPYPLAFNYPRWDIAGDRFLDFVPLLGIAAMAFVFLKYYSAWGRAPFLGLGAFLVTLFPVLSFFDIYGMRYSFVADHWVYLPALPVLVLVGLGLDRLSRYSETISRAACAVILILCGWLTWQHSRVFENRETLWNDTIAKNADSFVAHYNLGAVLQKQGRIDEAIHHLQQAVRIKPKHVWAHLNLGLALQARQRIDEAIVHYQAARRIDPNLGETHFSLGVALQEKGRIDEAIGYYREALRLKPNQVKAHLNLGIALQGRQQIDEAIVHFQAARRLAPDNAEAHFNLGNNFLKQNRIDEAIGCYREALHIRPGYARAHNNLGVALLGQKEIDAAINHFLRAMQIEPGYPDGERNLQRARQLQQQNR